MAALGLVAHARTAAELQRALTAGRKQAVPLAPAIDAASLVLAATPRVTVRLRARLARAAATAAAVTLMLLALVASDATYPVVAEALALPDSSMLSTRANAVALVVRGDRPALLALGPIARREHLHASLAASGPLTVRDVATLRADGLDPIPVLHSGGVASVFATRSELRDQAARYRLRGRFYYLAPGEGFTIGDYLVARELGGTPVQAGAELTPGLRDLPALHAGEVVVAALPRGEAGRGSLLSSIRRLERQGLVVSSVQRLARTDFPP
jgi:hypothetical protein